MSKLVDVWMRVGVFEFGALKKKKRKSYLFHLAPIEEFTRFIPRYVGLRVPNSRTFQLDPRTWWTCYKFLWSFLR